MSRARDNANLSPTIADARMPNLTGDVTTVEGAVATTIANDAVDSQHYAAGSIDNEHLADDAVGTDELANDIAITTSGATALTNTLTVGVNDTGQDVKFFGASSGAFMLYDESVDTLEIRGAAADATTSTGKLLLSTALTDINDGDVIGRIDFQAPLEGGGTDAILVGASIWAEADAEFTSINNSTELVFATNSSGTASEKMRIDSSGNVGIGFPPQLNTLVNKLYINSPSTQTALNSTSCAIKIGGAQQIGYVSNIGFIWDGGSAHHPYATIGAISTGAWAGYVKGALVFGTRNTTVDEASTERMRIAADGTFTGSTSADISDERLKENITTIPDALTKIKALTGRTFNWKPEAQMDTALVQPAVYWKEGDELLENVSVGDLRYAEVPAKTVTHYGLIAQELEAIVPDLVYNESGIRSFDVNGNLKDQEAEVLESDEYAKSVVSSGLIPVLVEAVKELSAKVTALESA